MRLTRLKPRKNRRELKGQAMAGFLFSMVGIPQAMAHALLTGVNPVHGLYALMAATPVAAIFTGSTLMNVSTTSALAVATGDALALVPASERTQHLAVLVLLVGILQTVAGVLKLGRLIRFVSNSVMVGFLTGVAILIVLGQLGDFSGYESVYRNKVLQLADLLLNLDQIDQSSTALGSVTLLAIWGLSRTRLRNAAMMLALVIATGLALLFGNTGVATVGGLTPALDELGAPVIPDLRLAPRLFSFALSITIIGLVQGAAVSTTFPNPDGKYPNASRDFLGQGVANLVAGLAPAIPAGGSVSGTSLISEAGGTGRIANFFAGILVIPIVWLFMDVLLLIPMPAMAALLLVVGIQSLRPAAIRTVWNTGTIPRTAMLLTLASTLIMPLQYAVFLGVGVSLVLHLGQESNHIGAVEMIMVPGGYPIEAPVPDTLPSHRVTVVNIYGSLFFAAASSMLDVLPDPRSSKHGVLILVLRGRDEVGSTYINMLTRYCTSLHNQSGQLMLAGIGDHVYRQLERTGTLSQIGPDNVFCAEPQLGTALNRALAAASRWLTETQSKFST